MPEIETLGILEEISALVSDRLQVVSYKWLSRNFLVSSNVAKKLLQDFVENHKDGLETIYTVAGWLKNNPPTYHIRLVPGSKLGEAKQDFDDNCSVQVYSVQACIPKDPAAIWNAEFIQAEELFKQPRIVDNCLLDNRFCGVSNSFVKRNAEGAPLANVAPQTKDARISGLATGPSANQTGSHPQLPQKKMPLSSPKLPDSCDLLNKEVSNKEKVFLPPDKKKGQSDKSSAGSGGSLANFWGRASTKSKSTSSSADDKSDAPKTNDSADAQICARETLDAVSSDEDEPDVNFKRASNGDGGKKRRVVLDDSDEDNYEDAVNLGSPDPPKEKTFQDSKQKKSAFDIEMNTLNFGKHEECKPKGKEEKSTDAEVNHPPEENSSSLDKGKPSDLSTSNKNEAIDGVPGSPKRRKVLKTRIDERGREVTEVVWEGQETDMNNKNAGKNSTDNLKNNNGHSVKVEDNARTNPVNRAAITKKSPAAGSTVASHAAGKAGNKKGVNAKDPKQGNILSFFKRV